jgi:hypothetical protein
MELDQLKAIWKEAGHSSLPINESSLNQMLNHQSKLPIAVMKRNLRLEVLFVILLDGFIVWQIYKKGVSQYLLYDISIIVFAILFFIYARYKYKLLNKMECMRCVVKSNLNLQFKSLEKLVKLYFHSANIAVILIYMVTGVISYVEAQGESVSFPQTQQVLIFLSVGVVLIMMNYYFGRWYLFNLYGKHIQKLKNILHEMDESEPR